MNTVRRSNGKRPELDFLWLMYACLNMLTMFSTFGSGAIGNGTTNGRLRTTASATGRVAGVEVTKASTDDLWNLSAQTATGAAAYRAFWLYIDSAGTASFVAGTDATSAVLALAALPAHDETKCILGVYVANPSTNFANALAAQGTIYNRIPAGVPCGVPGKTYVTPARLDLIGS